MLNRCACLLTDKLCRRGVVEEQKRPVFIYGFELLMSTLSSMVSIFIFSLLLGAPYASLCFFVAFMGLRFFAGGYHAPTYRLCHRSISQAAPNTRRKMLLDVIKHNR